MLDCQFFIHAGKSSVIIINQLKSIYNSKFKESDTHPIHTCFLIIASNGNVAKLVIQLIYVMWLVAESPIGRTDGNVMKILSFSCFCSESAQKFSLDERETGKQPVIY